MRKEITDRCYYLIVNGEILKEHRHRKFLEIYARENELKDYEIKEGK